MLRDIVLLLCSLVIYLVALICAVHAPQAQPAWGLTKDEAYLVMVATAALLLICGTVIGYISLLAGPTYKR